MIDKLSLGIKIFGAAMMIIAACLITYSLFRPAVTKGPMPPEPAPMLRK